MASKEVRGPVNPAKGKLEAQVLASDWKDITLTNGGGARSIIFLKKASDGL
jgi:hypothetical protein